jgi:YidC/Oxa1 family membrane protein insertase
VAGRLADGSNAVLTGASNDPQAFYPAYVDSSSDLFIDLSGETEMLFLGFDLSRSAGTALSQGLTSALPYLFLILIVFASSWIQQRQIRGRNPDATVNPQQQMLMKVMPFFLPVISFNLDAALVMYFVVSNLYRIAQQAYITQTLYGPGGDHAEVVVPASAEPTKKSGGGKSGSSKSGTKAGGKSGNSTGGKSGNRPSTSGSVRSGRTTAGIIENSSQKIDDGVPSKDDSRSRKKRARKSRSSASPAKKKASRRGRSAASDDIETTDKRPPAGRSGGGRTTPPGTARARSAKKRRK